MTNQKKNLLFLVSDEQSAEKTSASATLAWLAEEVNFDFETYITVEPKLLNRSSMAFTGDWHAEQFYFVANFYNVIYCAMTTSETPQFKREAKAFAKILRVDKPDQIADFYIAIFKYFNKALPQEVVAIPGGTPPEGDPWKAPFWIEPFCYPEIFFRKALGVSINAPKNQWERLKEAGVKKIHAVYCSMKDVGLLRKMGFAVEVVDEIKENDSYGSLTLRIVDRWIDCFETMAFGDQFIMLRSLGFFLRHRAAPFYEPLKWKEYVKKVSTYADKIGGERLVWGNQIVYPAFSDDLVTEFSKYDLSMSLGIYTVGASIREKIHLEPDWLTGAKAPWESEYSDAFLEEQIAEGNIPVCFLLYAADLGHLTTFARLFDILTAPFARCGLGFPSTWYDFAAENLEQLYIPYQQGGVFPRCEPLLTSTGLGVGTEAKGFMTKTTQIRQLKKAFDSIKTHLGSRLIPIGYYPWQDTCPYYKCQSGEAQFDVAKEVGFDYSITYKDEGKSPRIVYQDRNFISINQQNIHWRGDGPEKTIQNWEKKIIDSGKPGWIMIGLDAPFWCQPPFYYDPEYFPPASYGAETSVTKLMAAMRYAAKKGSSEKLFLAKPHEVVRFARMLRAKKLI